MLGVLGVLCVFGLCFGCFFFVLFGCCETETKKNTKPQLPNKKHDSKKNKIITENEMLLLGEKKEIVVGDV